MNGLGEALEELAGRARVYDVTEPALRAARRRRRATRLVPAVAGVAMAVVVVSGWAALDRPGSHRGSPARVAASPTHAAASGLPPGLPVLQQSPPELPDHGIGPAALVYESQPPIDQLPATRGWTLVTSAGTQYQIAATYQGQEQSVLGLSPDGHWLALERSGAVVLRDLLGTTVRTVAGWGPGVRVLWSPDGALVAVANPDDRPDEGYSDHTKAAATVVGLASDLHRVVPLGTFRDLRPVLLTDGGDLILAGDRGGASLPLTTVDSASGRQVAAVTVRLGTGQSGQDLRGWNTHEPLEIDAGYVLDGSTVLIQLTRDRTDKNFGTSLPDDVVAVDPATGTVTRTYPVEDPQLQEITLRQGQTVVPLASGRWSALAGRTADGLLMVSVTPGADGMATPNTIALVAPDTGATTVVTRITGERIVAMLLRGQG